MFADPTLDMESKGMKESNSHRAAQHTDHTVKSDINPLGAVTSERKTPNAHVHIRNTVLVLVRWDKVCYM